jgi:bifunctional UDP-N-acetylglucosamine pyrophosphorylase/glucosamine-1-phosphate N-acetyltransferase
MTTGVAVYAVVLAAGEGTRMRSARPKPLHAMCGLPMVLHVIGALRDVAPAVTVVVTGHAAREVRAEVSTRAPQWARVAFARQEAQLGTGDAARAGLEGLEAHAGPELDDASTVIVMPGDTPLLRPATVAMLAEEHEKSGNAATLLTALVDDPFGYGRVLRGREDRVVGVVEERDATPEQRGIGEVNTGIYAFRRDLLGPALRRIENRNSQREYYLTDVVGVLAGMGHRVGSHTAPAAEVTGVNDRWQLALAERELRARTNRQWLLEGVTMFDPRQTFIDVTVRIGRDVTLLPGTILQGTTTIGDGCEIGPDTRLVDATVGDGARVEQTVARGATIGAGAVVGPYAHLVAGDHLADGAVTGAFYDGRATGGRGI